MISKVIVVQLIIAILLSPLIKDHCEAATKKNNTIPLISIGTGIFIGSTTLYLILRSSKKKHAQAEYVIDYVDSLWNQMNTSYFKGDYSEATHIAQQIRSSWEPYQNALARKKRHTIVSLDSLSRITYNCQLYENIKPSYNAINKLTESIPANEDQLLKWNRHDLLALLDTIRRKINDSISVHKNDTKAVTAVFQPILLKLAKVDSLFLKVYDSEQLNFSVKNRFYYNRVIEDSSHIALQRFVDDCDYYNVDKKWCEQARVALRLQSTRNTVMNRDGNNLSKSKIPTEIDKMNMAYHEAISSKSIELLEQYLKKYSVRKFRRAARLDSVQMVLKAVRREINFEQSFSKNYPRFSEGSVNKISVTIEGASQKTIEDLKKIIKLLQSDFNAITSLRYPATLYIDYRSSPSLYLLSGYVHGKKDISFIETLDARRYTMAGAQNGFKFIDKLARRCTEYLKNTGKRTSFTPAYAVRFVKNGTTYLTMYGSGKKDQGVNLFNFYDVAIPGTNNTRIPYNFTDYTILLDKNSDSLQVHPGNVYFEK